MRRLRKGQLDKLSTERLVNYFMKVIESGATKPTKSESIALSRLEQEVGYEACFDILVGGFGRNVKAVVSKEFEPLVTITPRDKKFFMGNLPYDFFMNTYPSDDSSFFGIDTFSFY